MTNDSALPSGSVPVSFRYWQDAAKSLLEPLLALMAEGRAHIPIAGRASDHCLNADRLESFARPFLLFCHWETSLRSYCEAGDRDALQKGKTWFRDALLIGTDPVSDQFFGYSTNYRQHSVEIGLLAIAFEMSRPWLWDLYTESEREQVLVWLESDAGSGHHWNNHLFFGVFLLEFLAAERGESRRYRSAIDWYFDELEKMYAGDGWYRDGSNQAFDFYNAYSWHYYPLWWIRLHGEKNPARCERFAARTRLFLENYGEFFADSGEHAAFGRSITYRFNASAPISLAHLVGVSPLSPGKSRRLCSRSLSFFLERPIFQKQGCLSIGWIDEFPALAESYSCGASPYWAAKAFAPLLLLPDDSFWVEEEPEGESSDTSVALTGPSLIVRKTNGATEIINVGTQIGSSNTRFGVHKWGRLSYKSGWGFTLPASGDVYPVDGSLTAQMEGSDLVYGRHSTVPLVLTDERMACMYSLGGKEDGLQVSVHTMLWWRGDWQLALHCCTSWQNVTLCFGSYPLSYDEEQSVAIEESEGVVQVVARERAIVLQSLLGYDSVGTDQRSSLEGGARRSIQAPCHATGLLLKELDAREPLFLISLSYAGARSDAARLWSVAASDPGKLALEHADLGSWVIEDEALPAT